MTVFFDGNGNEISISGGSSGTTATYQPYSYYEAIGDSLTYGSGYPSKVANILQITNVVSHAQNGAHLIGASGSGNGTMLGQAEQVAETCDLCTIMGGTNDSAAILADKIGEIGTKDTTTFLGTYQTIIETLLAKNPSMRIILLKPPRRYDMADTSYLKKIGECIDKLREHYGTPVIDVFNDLGMNEFNYTSYLNESDKLHFNSKGANFLSTFVAHKILSV